MNCKATKPGFEMKAEKVTIEFNRGIQVGNLQQNVIYLRQRRWRRFGFLPENRGGQRRRNWRRRLRRIKRQRERIGT
jgi:hypothetical protein